MDSSVAIAAGILGFLSGYVFDLASLRPVRGLRAVLWVAHSVLILYSTVALCLVPERVAYPPALIALGVVILVPSAILEFYSLFFNLPFGRVYVADTPTSQVIKTGTYALVRHPSVLWYAFMLVGMILVSGSQPLLYTAPLWMFLDILWVVGQERFVFPKTLEGYDQYQKETPMLIPNASSIKAFLASVSRPKEVKEGAGAGGS